MNYRANSYRIVDYKTTINKINDGILSGRVAQWETICVWKTKYYIGKAEHMVVQIVVFRFLNG